MRAKCVHILVRIACVCVRARDNGGDRVLATVAFASKRSASAKTRRRQQTGFADAHARAAHKKLVANYTPHRHRIMCAFACRFTRSECASALQTSEN